MNPQYKFKNNMYPNLHSKVDLNLKNLQRKFKNNMYPNLLHGKVDLSLKNLECRFKNNMCPNLNSKVDLDLNPKHIKRSFRNLQCQYRLNSQNQILILMILMILMKNMMIQ